MAFSFSQEKRNGVIILEVKGYLNLEGGRELRQRIAGLIDKKETLFVVDFREAPLVSSQALGQILDLITEIIPNQAIKLAFAALSEVARLSMGTLGLLEYVPDYPTRDEALAALRAGG